MKLKFSHRQQIFAIAEFFASKEFHVNVSIAEVTCECTIFHELKDDSIIRLWLSQFDLPFGFVIRSVEHDGIHWVTVSFTDIYVLAK